MKLATNRYYIALIVFCFSLSIVYGQNIDFKEYRNPSVEKTKRYIKGNEYQKDFLLFVDMLKECHPAFALEWTPPFDLDSVKRAGYKQVKKYHSDKDFSLYVQSILSPLKDGHTTVYQDFSNQLLYPLMYFQDDAGTYVLGIDEVNKSFLGKQIIEINGHTVEKVSEAFKRLVSNDNDVRFSRQMGAYIRFYSMWEDTPYHRPDSSLVVSFADTTAAAVLHPVKAQELKYVFRQGKNMPETMQNRNKLPFRYFTDMEKSICYLQFNSCEDQNTIRAKYAQRNSGISEKEEKMIARYPKFDTLLVSMFEMIRANDIKTVVIDVRRNGGGNSVLCDMLLSWLKPRKEMIGFGGYMRASSLWEKTYPQLAQNYKQDYARKGQVFEMGKLFGNAPRLASTVTDDPNFPMNNDKNLIFKGNVVFIQSSDTYSSAGLMLTKARDNHIGMIIGQKSSYAPCHYGDILVWKLPNTGLKGTVSHKKFIRPDEGKCTEDSLIPDVYLHYTWKDFLEGRDICWEWILENFSVAEVN